MAKDTTRRRLAEHLEFLPVKLNEAELLERAKKIGRVHNELEQHKLQSDDVKKKIREKEQELEQERQLLAHILFTGAEPRKTTVEAWANFAANRFEEIRTDTGELINRRPLRPDEKQENFEFDEESWAKQLHLRLVQQTEDAAKKRAGDVEKDDEP